MAELPVNLDAVKSEIPVKAEISQENIAEQPVERKRKRKPRVKSADYVVKMKKNRRDRANDRERNRMHSLNDALETLREILPNGADGKMTKIETLRTAYNYIWALSQTVKMLDNEPEKIPFMKMDSLNGENCVVPRANFLTNETPDLLSTFSSMCSSPQLASPGSDTSDYSSQYDSQFIDSPVYSPHYQGQVYPADSMQGNYMTQMPYNNVNKNMYPFPSNQSYQDFVNII